MSTPSRPAPAVGLRPRGLFARRGFLELESREATGSLLALAASLDPVLGVLPWLAEWGESAPELRAVAAPAAPTAAPARLPVSLPDAWLPPQWVPEPAAPQADPVRTSSAQAGLGLDPVKAALDRALGVGGLGGLGRGRVAAAPPAAEPLAAPTKVGAPVAPMDGPTAGFLAGVGVAPAGSPLDGGPPAEPAAATGAGAAAGTTYFEPNVGQAGAGVEFVGRGGGVELAVDGGGLTFTLHDPGVSDDRGDDAWASVRMALDGADQAARAYPFGRLPGVTNYLTDPDPGNWQTGVPHYAGVTVAGVYDGVDLVVYSTAEGQFEYDFVVAPGGDPGAIQVTFDGAGAVAVGAGGELVVGTSAGDLTLSAPVTYQDRAGARVEVASRYAVAGGSVGFAVGGYDPALPLVIDPVVVAETAFNAGSSDTAFGVDTDAAGNTYTVGHAVFPTTFEDVAVTKLNPAWGLAYTTFIGGTRTDWGQGIAVADDGSVAVTGATFSWDSPDFPDDVPFPTTPGAYQPAHFTSPTYPVPTCDAFIVKLDPSGGGVVFSTLLGGFGQENDRDVLTRGAVAMDPAGNVYATGNSWSIDDPLTPEDEDLPTVNALKADSPDAKEAFVAKFGPGGAVVYATYLGGATGRAMTGSDDEGWAIAADADGNAYVSGLAGSGDFPLVNPISGPIGDAADAFVAKLSPSGSLVFSTYVGGTGYDVAYDLQLDAGRNIYLTGTTASPDLPTTPGAFEDQLGGYTDAYLFKLRSPHLTGSSQVDFATYYGGSDSDVGYGISVDALGQVYVAGATFSGDLPTGFGGQVYLGGYYNGFVAGFASEGRVLIGATYFGGGTTNQLWDIAVKAVDVVNEAVDVAVVGWKWTGEQIRAAAAWLNFWLLPVIDVIPNGESSETDQNSEPSVATSPSRPRNLVLSSFGPAGGPHPYFTSTVSGGKWDHFGIHNYALNDVTLAWSSGGTAYDATMRSNAGPVASEITVGKSPNPHVNAAANAFATVDNSKIVGGVFNIDQPHIAVSRGGGSDRVFVGFNDINSATNAFLKAYVNPAAPAALGGNGKTAGIWFSTNADAGGGKAAWTRVGLDSAVPGVGADGSVYVATQGDIVYAVFSRFNVAVGAAPGSDFTGDLVVVRDDKLGANNFADLDKNVVAGVTFPVYATKLGANQKLLGSGLSIAVDPNNTANVFVAVTTVNAGAPEVKVYSSANSGAAWALKHTVANAALPALAVSNNGTVGLLYTELAGGNLVTHFARTKNNFVAVVDKTLATFPDGTPASVGDPYIGDYQSLVVVGDHFYGTFSASNDPDPAHFPRGVYYQRNVEVGGKAFDHFRLTAKGDLLDNAQAKLLTPGGAQFVSIDPFFFRSRELA